jgi:hypothetical protein
VRQPCQAACASAGLCASLILTCLKVVGGPRDAEKVLLGARGSGGSEGTYHGYVALRGAGFGQVASTPRTLGGAKVLEPRILSLNTLKMLLA